MVKPGIDFIAIIFALFKLGAVPVMIDPGMGVARMLACIRSTDARGFIGVPIAHAVRVLKRRAFTATRHAVTVGRRWFWRGPTLARLARDADSAFTITDTNPSDTAAILFTSGATGPPKGVVYEHAMFHAQVRTIRDHYAIEPGEVDLPAFPLFALFSTAMGMTCVIPDIDPSHPARANPAHIVEAVQDHHVTNTFGSPAIWSRVAGYCADRGITLPTLRRVLIAGAPVQPDVVERMRRALPPGADLHTPYGATESLPATSISGTELLDGCLDRTRNGDGICVGRPVAGVTVRLIRVTDDPIARWSDDLVLPDGDIGEIAVAGDVVTKTYYELPRADALAKIHDPGAARVWHRIGDLGYRDADGRIWMCGRKAHRVHTATGMMCTVRCEAVFNAHPAVARSALVGIGPPPRQRPVIIIEPESHARGDARADPHASTDPESARRGAASEKPQAPRRAAAAGGSQASRRGHTRRRGRMSRRARAALLRELHDTAERHDLTRPIRDVLFHESLPVDIRHNAKINREALTDWAAKQLR
ncbi:MAG: fatty acid CoA ligase family protein, partial [Phycisphaerae bacterium]